MARRVSYSRGPAKLTHNDRTLIAPNVDESRTKDNIIIKNQSLAAAYEEVFGAAKDEYNAKQKRKDRKIDDYFKKLFGCSADDNKATEIIKNDLKQQSFYEWVVGIGSAFDTALVDWTTQKGEEYKANPEAAQLAAECLKIYMLGDEKLGIESYEKRNPNFHVVQAIIHMDERTPHLHKDVIPFADGFKKGMTRQQGIAKALEAMGYGTGELAIRKWQESERGVFEDICEAKGFEVAAPEKGRGYTVATHEYADFIEAQRAKEEEQKKAAAAKEQREDEEKKTAAAKEQRKGEEQKAAAAKEQREDEEKKAAAVIQQREGEEQKANAARKDREEEEKKAAIAKRQRQFEEFSLADTKEWNRIAEEENTRLENENTALENKKAALDNDIEQRQDKLAALDRQLEGRSIEIALTSQSNAIAEHNRRAVARHIQQLRDKINTERREEYDERSYPSYPER